jgi:predicted metal-binding protein
LAVGLQKSLFKLDGDDIMTKYEILTLAESMGFQARFLPTSEVPVNAEFLKYCEENRCGNYGANYACPPDCGTPEEMYQKMLSADLALVLQSQWDIPGYGTPEVLSVRTKHTHSVRSLMVKLRQLGYDVFGMGYGGCNLCDPCKRKEGNPCAFPELRMNCLSAYCVDAVKLADICDLPFDWNPRKLHLFGMILFCQTHSENAHFLT